MTKYLFFIYLPLLFWSCGEKKQAPENTSTPENKPNEEVAKTQSTPEIKDKEVDKVIEFYFTPSVDDRLVREKGQELLDFLSKETGFKYKINIPKDYDEMITDFGNGKADVAIMNSQSYIKANEMFGASAKLRAVRYGKSTYFGQIIANTDKGINSLKDIQGRTVAFTDRSSTSGYLFPQKILKESGIKPGKTVFAGKHDTVVKMVYDGIVDAGAAFYAEPSSDGSIRDARARIIDKYPDVIEKVKIIAITEPIPNDPVVFSKDLPSDISYKISLGLIKFVSTDVGKNVMVEMYSTEGFVRCADTDYDDLRKAMEE